jgi:hypothetical protein
MVGQISTAYAARERLRSTIFTPAKWSNHYRKLTVFIRPSDKAL